MNGKYRGVVKGIDTPKNRWAFGDRVKIGDRVYIVLDDAEIESANSNKMYLGISGIVEVIPKSVGQSIWLKETKPDGKVVYQGDVVIFDDSEIGGRRIIAEVIWNDDRALGTLGWHLWVVGGGGFVHTDFLGQLEIIGNIHDDPKLLEAEE